MSTKPRLPALNRLGFVIRLLVLAAAVVALQRPLQGQIQLKSTDWLNRGRTESCTVLEGRGLLFVEMDRGNEDNDLSVFRFATSPSDTLEHLGTVQGFGSSVTRFGDNLVSSQKERGLCLWDVTSPLAPKLLSSLPDIRDEIWGYRYSPALFVSSNRLFAIRSTEVIECSRAGNSLSVLRRSTVPQLNAGRYHPFPEMVAMAGDVVYTASQDSGALRLSALQRGSNGALIASWHTTVPAQGGTWQSGAVARITADRKFLLATAGGDTGILIYSLARPTSPILLSRVPCQKGQLEHVMNLEFIGPRRVAISAQRLFVADLDETGGLSLLPESQKPVVPTSMRWVNDRLFVGGWWEDLRVLRLDDLGRLSVVADADPNLGIECMSGDAGFAYVMSERKEERRCILNARRADSGTGRFGPPEQLMDVPSFGNANWGIAACAGRVAATDGRVVYLFTRNADGTHRSTHSAGVRGSFSWPSTNEALSLSPGYVRAGREVFEITRRGQLRSLGQPEWAERSILVGDHAVVRDEGQLSVYRLPQLSFAGSFLATPLDMRVQGNSLLFHETNAVRELSISETGTLQLWDLTPSDRIYDGGRNLTVTEDLVLSWYGTSCEMYARFRDKRRLRFLGTSPMTSHLCHGGWYGFASEGMFFTADAFAGVNAFQIRREFIRSFLDASEASPVVRWNGIAGTRYQPMESSDLRSWWPVGDSVLGAGRWLSVRPGGGESHRFFGIQRVLE
jgi:hypothetical protein